VGARRPRQDRQSFFTIDPSASCRRAACRVRSLRVHRGHKRGGRWTTCTCPKRNLYARVARIPCTTEAGGCVGAQTFEVGLRQPRSTRCDSRPSVLVRRVAPPLEFCCTDARAFQQRTPTPRHVEKHHPDGGKGRRRFTNADGSSYITFGYFCILHSKSFSQCIR
jgi:hypothetical protein